MVSLIQNILRKNLESLPSNSHENQSEDDSESTDDGLDLFTDQIHLSTSRQWLCLSYMTSVFVFCFFFSY